MRTALGISAGSEVVGSALLSTAANGAQSWTFRVMSTDGAANTDLGDLIASSIELMTTQLPDERIEPGGIAVAYRSEDQVQAVRTAVGPQRRELQLVPESTAALTYLRSTGEVARFDTVALFDLGAGGLTVTVLDRATGDVLATRRTDDVSGSALDTAVADHLIEHHGRSVDRGPLARRARAAKEHLSTSDSVSIDLDAAGPVELSRTEFDEAIGGLSAAAVAFTREVIAEARRPDVLAVIGGGGNIPLFRTALADELDITVLAPDEPESVNAKGAALVADAAGPASFPVAVVSRGLPSGTFAKVAALIGALVVIGWIVGYGLQLVAPGTPGADDVATTSVRSPQTSAELVTAPTTTTTEVTLPIPTGAPFPTYEQPGTTYEASTSYYPTTYPESTTTSSTSASATSTTTTTATTTPPTLRPAPDLPTIPWPEIQRFFPMPGQQPPSETNVTTTTPTPVTATSTPGTTAPEERVQPSTTPTPSPAAPTPAPPAVLPGFGSSG